MAEVDEVNLEPDYAGLLRRLAISDDGTLAFVVESGSASVAADELSDKVRTLVSLAALIAIESAPPSFQRAVGLALAAGATEGEVVGVLCSVAATVGTARVSSAAANVASALGHDLDRMLED